MSLKNVDISKVNKLSLRGIKLPPVELRDIDKVEPIEIVKPLSDEIIAYSKLTALNPLLGYLIDRLSLVSETTGDRLIVNK